MEIEITVLGEAHKILIQITFDLDAFPPKLKYQYDVPSLNLSGSSDFESLEQAVYEAAFAVAAQRVY